MDAEEYVAELRYLQRLARRRARRAYPDMVGKVVHHIDGDPTNNELDNLVMIDPRENVRDR